MIQGREKLIYLLIISHFFFISKVQAQTLIVGVPSADTTPKDEILVTHESQLAPWNRRSWWNSYSFLTYGLNERTEIALSLSNLEAPKTDNLSLSAGFKTSIPVLTRYPKWRNKITVGSFVPVSLQGEGVGNWSFGHYSVFIPKTKTRFTAGVSYGTKQIFARDAVSFIGGIEQPINKKISLVADWYSGTHALAALIPAIQYNINKSDILILGLKIPNNSRSTKMGIVFEFTKRLK